MVLAGMLLLVAQTAVWPGVVQAAAPTASVGGPYSGDEGAQVAFSGDGNDAEDQPEQLTYEWDFDRQATFVADVSGVNLTSTSHVYPDNGSFTVALRVKDTALEVSSESTATVTVGNVPPNADVGGPYAVDEGSLLTFSGSATDPGQDTLTFEWDFTYDGATFNIDATGDDLTGPSTTYLDDGANTVALRVRDEDGGVSSIQTATVTVSNVPTYLGNEGALVTFTGTANDPGSDTLTYEWDFTVALRVRDDETTSVESTAAVTISNVLPTPDAGGPYVVTAGDSLTNAGSATDPGNDTLTYEWDFEYDGVTFDTSGGATDSGIDLTGPSYTYTTDGIYTVALRVQDDEGASAVVTAQVTVNPSGAVPTPTAIVPSVSEWGLLAMSMVMAAGFAWRIRRSRRGLRQH